MKMRPLHNLVFGSSLLMMVALSACGAQVDLEARSQSCPATRAYPDTRYLKASAQGGDREEARDRARATLSRQLSAELNAQLIVTAESDSEGDRAELTERVQVETHFRHAELIETLSQCELCSGQECVTWVALNRDQAAQRLIEEATPDLETFRRAVSDLNDSSPLPRFVQSWRRAVSAYQRLLGTLNQLQLLGRITPDLRNVSSSMRRAHQIRAARRARLWVSISSLRFDQAPEGINLQSNQQQQLQSTLDGALSQALTQINLKRSKSQDCTQAQLSSSPSSSPLPDVIMITPHGQLRCSLGFVGPECRLTLGVTLGLCGQAELSKAEWTQLNLFGVHKRELQGALLNLQKKITRTEFTDVLKHTLSPLH